MAADWCNAGFGLYLHWPFCQAKCPYCDFNSHVATKIDQARLKKAFLDELDHISQGTNARILNTVFFGGGTPSLMDPELVWAILNKVRAIWRVDGSPEITLEANPSSVEAGRFAGYRDAGVNRVSMGIQALNDEDLKKLGRLHSADEARTAFDIARSVFDRVSFDLIYGRQKQSLAAWEDELKQALNISIDHLSLYQLTIEENTAFAARYAAGKLHGLPDDDLAADMYLATQEICDAAGFDGYEISNHARPGRESRHNLIYWRCGDYVGVGPGAHGRITERNTRWAVETHRAPEKWLTAVERNGTGQSIRKRLPPREQAEEYLMMSLRLREGTDLKRLEKLDADLINPGRINALEEEGLLSLERDRLRATTQGKPVLNGILRALMTA